VLVNVETALHSFCARILGWTADRELAVEQAIRSIELAADHSAALVLLGETDLVPIAHALHRYILGSDKPFVVCDPQRRNVPASVRSPENRGNGVVATVAATGGSLCVRVSRLPQDFSELVTLVRKPDAHVQLIITASGRYDTHPFLTLPVPIRVPSLRTRTSELSRIVDEYAADAIASLGAGDDCFTDEDRRWIVKHCPLTLPEIEKATLRLVALRVSKNPTRAAERLGMAPVSLSRWIDRRKLRPMLATT
jgi:hypothetical protein